MEIENLIESFSEFKEVKNINRETMMNILEDVFKSVLAKKYDELQKKQPRLVTKIDDTTVILLYILSFFIPLAGFIVGAIYASKEEEHYKHVGKNCLFFSVLNLVLGFIVIVAIIAG